MSVDFQLLSARSFTAPLFQAQGRRAYQRITLTEKVVGTLGTDKVVLFDISLSGVLVAHENPRQLGDRATLSFDWKGSAIVVECEVMRTEIYHGSKGGRPIWRSGLAFRRHLGRSEAVLREMVTELVERALDERRSNARGVPPRLPSSLQRGTNSRYLKLRFLHNVWQKTETGDAIQPHDGFTVSFSERADQIQLLCDTYEKLSDQDRDLVRKMAALSISNPDGTPARRYDP